MEIRKKVKKKTKAQVEEKKKTKKNWPMLASAM